MDKVCNAIRRGKGTDDDPLKGVKVKPWNKKFCSLEG